MTRKVSATHHFVGCDWEVQACNTKEKGITHERRVEVWNSIQQALTDHASAEGTYPDLSVTHSVEQRCRKIAEVLCDTHLTDEVVKVDEVHTLAEKYAIRGKNKTKGNILKQILKAILSSLEDRRQRTGIRSHRVGCESQRILKGLYISTHP